MLLDSFHHLLLPLLFVTGVIGGTVDAIAGGGGLVALPVLLGIGIPPHVALGTNKLQAFVGTAIATNSYYRHGLLSGKKIYQGIIFTLIGSTLGAIANQLLSADFLKKLIPFLLCIILMYTLFSPKLGRQHTKAKMNESVFYVIFGMLLGFYDGFFGPGVGSFWAFVLIFFLGYDLVKATAHTKAFNLASNVAATLCFIVGNHVDYRLALCMAAGQVIGGRLGAHLAIKKGAALIRPLFLIMVSTTILTLVCKNYFSHEVTNSGKILSIGLFIVILSGMAVHFRKQKTI